MCIRYISFHIIPFSNINLFDTCLSVILFVVQYLKSNPEIHTPPLLQFHGIADNLVPIKWGEESRDNLKELGVNVQFVPLDHTDHELSRTEIQSFKEWLLNIVPEKISD